MYVCMYVCSDEAYQRKAFSLERRLEFGLAIPMYEAGLRCVKNDYQRASLLLNLARAHNKLKNFADALRLVSEALKLSTDFAPAIELKAITEEEMGDSKASLATRTDFINKFPRRRDGHVQRGCLYQRLGKFTEAIHDFKNAIKLDATPEYTHRSAFRIAECFMSQSQSQPTEALQWLSKCRSTLKVALRRGIANQQLKKYDEAIRLYTSLLERSTAEAQEEHASAFYNRGLCYISKYRDMAANDKQWLLKAKADLENAIIISQDNQSITDAKIQLTKGTPSSPPTTIETLDSDSGRNQ